MQFIAILTSASDLEQQLGQCASSKGFIGCVIANCKDNLDLSPDIERVLEQYNGTVLLLKETDGKVFTRIFGSLRGELSVQLTLKEGGTVFRINIILLVIFSFFRCIYVIIII